MLYFMATCDHEDTNDRICISPVVDCKRCDRMTATSTISPATNNQMQAKAYMRRRHRHRHRCGDRYIQNRSWVQLPIGQSRPPSPAR